MNKYVKLGGIAFLVFFVAYRPNSASRAVERIVAVVGDLANGFGDFFSNVIG